MEDEGRWPKKPGFAGDVLWYEGKKDPLTLLKAEMGLNAKVERWLVDSWGPS